MLRWIRVFVALVAPGMVLAVPAAQAQLQSFGASYSEHFGTRNQPCPDGAYACGSGTVAEFGAFTELLVINDDGTFTRTLTFADASTLVLQESIVTVTNPGNSGTQPPFGAGRGNPPSGTVPNTALLMATVVGGSGAFAGLRGTDTVKVAGNSSHGTLTLVLGV
jgi:hypothetical protein